MSNIYPKSILKTKIEKDDSSDSSLRDPNIIFPQSGNSQKTLSSVTKEETATPVMLRSFNKDISDALEKKKNPPYVKKTEPQKSVKKSTVPVAPPVKKVNDSVTVNLDKKSKTKSIPNAPLPGKVVLKKENVSTKKTTVKKSLHVDNIKPIESVNEKLKEREDFLLEIFPKPPQVSQKEESEVKKSIKTSRKKNIVVDEKIKKKQELHNDFDRMIYGEYVDDKNSLDTDKELVKTEESVVSVHMSDDNLKKLLAEINDIKKEEKELQINLQELARKEITLTKEENELESEKNLVKKELDNVLEQENEIESIIHGLEKQANETKNVEKLHGIETKRWEQEEKRAQAEKNKWGLHERYDKLETSLKEKKGEIEKIRKDKNIIIKKQDPLFEKKRQKRIEIRLGEIEREKKGIENTQLSILEEKKNIDKTLSLLVENRKKVIEEERIAEENEKKVETVSDKRIFEEKRQNIEIRRRSIEQQRWEVEQKLKDILKRLTKANDQYNLVMKNEREVLKR